MRVGKGVLLGIWTQALEMELKDAAVERMRLAMQHDPATVAHQAKGGSSKEAAARLSEILSIQKELEVRACDGSA